MIQTTDSVPPIISRVDTLFIDRIDPLYNETYIQLLERSNDQLSLVGNPLAWLIGSLGVLFTIGAIISGYHILTMSNSFDAEKRKLLKDLENLKIKYEEDFGEIINANTAQLNSIQLLIKNLTEAGNIAKKDLDKLRGSIHRSANAIKNASRDIPMTIEYSRKGVTKCNNCKKEFSVSFEVPKELSKGGTIFFERECPNCGVVKQIHTSK